VTIKKADSAILVTQQPGIDPARTSLLKRLWSGKVATLLARNTLVSCCVFAFDLILLWALVDILAMGKILAAALAFVVANSIHYLFCRVWIFPGSARPMTSGYVYFFVNAGVGLLVTLILFDLLMVAAGMNYMIARVVASVFAGLASFLLNAVLNFKSV
jgi:putative flippase GtrA